MKIACLDFEGVLVPEMWLAVADKYNEDGLRITTRDIPDYRELMRIRLDVMAKRGLTIHDVQSAIAGLDPLPGAQEFLDWLRPRFQVAIISDTFYEFAAPLVAKLGFPMILCHRLDVEDNGNIADIRLRQEDPKRHSVLAFQSLKYKVVATGDSYNDTTMLKTADAGILFQPSQRVIDDFPEIPVALTYEELKTFFSDAAARLN
ncbi:MAG: bifunctional phosphoserine phosphatase/homoserine phosphotransferase ThrH [Gammaproteobacteria bacterium]|nr:bifunctional phosphoserine phosphatase/homoserine phosphotransferase ThrH [Gammaproteobacteria bacterium]